MTQNRYTPPGADLRTGGEDPPPVGSGDFDLGVCLSEAWSDTWSNFPLWLGALLLWLVAVAVATVTVIGFFVVVPVLFWGQFRFYLAMRDGNATLGDLFAGFSDYGPALVSMFLVALAYLGLSILAGIPGQVLSVLGTALESDALMLVGSLLNFALTMLITSRVWFAPWLSVDRRMNAVDAIRLSWRVTGPVQWKMAALALLASLVIPLAGLIVLVVGVLPAAVVGYMMVASAYRQVMGGGSAQTA